MDLQSSANTCFEQIFYTAQTALAYSVGRVAHGLANNGLTDAQRAALSPDDPEYRAAYVYLCRAPRSMSELTRLQGGRLENSSRWVDYIFGVDVVAQVVHAGILPSTYSKTGSTSVYCCNWCSCASAGRPGPAVSQSHLCWVRSGHRNLSRQRDHDLLGLPAIPQVLADQPRPGE